MSPYLWYTYRLTEGYGYDVLRQFIELFPNTPMACLIKGYLLHFGFDLSSEEKEEDSHYLAEEVDGLDLLLVIFVCSSSHY